MPSTEHLPAVTPDAWSLRSQHPSRQRSGAGDGARCARREIAVFKLIIGFWLVVALGENALAHQRDEKDATMTAKSEGVSAEVTHDVADKTISQSNTAIGGKVITYPAPAEARLSDHYKVSVNGLPLPVYAMDTDTRDGKYYFTSFDFSGRATVTVVSKRSLRNTVIRPTSYDVDCEFKEETFILHLDRPRNISVEPDGANSALLIFANSLETDVPDKDQSGVVYFGPGFHDAGRIDLTDGQMLYLAGGAVVKGAVYVKGTNVSVRGRGMLYGGDYPKAQGPLGCMFHIQDSADVTVRDIILCDSWHWTLVPSNSDRVTIKNVKICNSRFYNEDGIDLVNCRDVLIRDCFIRTKDDCIAVKGHDRSLTCERIRVEDCVLWTDGANIFRIGYESEAAGVMANDLEVRNIDVIHVAAEHRPVTDYWSHSVWCIQPCDNTPMGGMLFERVRIHLDTGPHNLIKIMPMVRQGWGWKGTEPGQYVKNVVFRNIEVTGTGKDPEAPVIFLSGVDESHNVREIHFENCSIYGRPLTRDHLNIGPFTGNVTVTADK